MASSKVPRLLVIIFLTLLFIAAELTVGFRTRSIAVIADAFHYVGDLICYIVAVVAELMSTAQINMPWISNGNKNVAGNEEASRKMFDRLAALFNGSFLLALGLGILLQGVERFVNLEELSNPEMVMIMGCVGLALNLISTVILGSHQHAGHGHDHGVREVRGTPEERTETADIESGARENQKETSGNDNHDYTGKHGHTTSLSIKAVIIHIAADALNNLAVVLSGALIWRLPPSRGVNGDRGLKVDPKNYADPASSVLISLIIMNMSVGIVKESTMDILTTFASLIGAQTFAKGAKKHGDTNDVDDTLHEEQIEPGGEEKKDEAK